MLRESFPTRAGSVVVLAARQPQSPWNLGGGAGSRFVMRIGIRSIAYVRRCGQSPHDAQDLTQEFFCRLLEKRWLDSADREKGKLRTFLIVALKNFMSKGVGSRLRRNVVAADKRTRKLTRPLPKAGLPLIPIHSRRTKLLTGNGRSRSSI